MISRGIFFLFTNGGRGVFKSRFDVVYVCAWHIEADTGGESPSVMRHCITAERDEDEF